MKKLSIALGAAFVLAGGGVVSAQELNCQVEVYSSQIEGTNKSVFETLQSSITE